MNRRRWAVHRCHRRDEGREEDGAEHGLQPGARAACHQARATSEAPRTRRCCALRAERHGACSEGVDNHNRRRDEISARDSEGHQRRARDERGKAERQQERDD